MACLRKNENGNAVNKNKDYYFKKLYDHFVINNDRSLFKLMKVFDFYMIKKTIDGNPTTVFKCPRTNQFCRNLYLEFHSFDYNCQRRLDEMPDTQRFIRNYPGEMTPPGTFR